MVGDNTVGDLDVSPGSEVARCGLEEEEWFFWACVVELFDMICIVSADGDNLVTASSLGHDTKQQGTIPSFPASQTAMLSTTFWLREKAHDVISLVTSIPITYC